MSLLFNNYPDEETCFNSKPKSRYSIFDVRSAMNTAGQIALETSRKVPDNNSVDFC